MNKVSWMRAACSDNGSTHSDADADAACRCWPFGGFMYASVPLIPGSQDAPARPHIRLSLSSRELSALRRPLKIAIKIEIGNKISAGRSPVAERITENYFLGRHFSLKVFKNVLHTSRDISIALWLQLTVQAELIALRAQYTFYKIYYFD